MGSHSGTDDSITRSPTKALEKRSEKVNPFSKVDRKGEDREDGLDLIEVVT
jgi:hypothetical protein